MGRGLVEAEIDLGGDSEEQGGREEGNGFVEGEHWWRSWSLEEERVLAR